MEKRISLYPAQFDFLTTGARFAAFIGGIGSGKTYAGCARALVECGREDGGLGLIVAPTYPMLRDATLRTFKDVASDAITDFHKGEMRAVVGNAEVLFRSADDPERLRGPNLSWAYVDEAALCQPMTWPIVIGRLRESGRAGPAWITTTPKGRNWVWKEFVEQQRDGYAVYRARTADNPYLSPRFLADLEAAYTGDFARQELYGEFVAFEGLVYDEFDRLVHVAEPPERLIEVVAGVDWGYTNPTVILVIGLDTDRRAHVLEEFYQRRRLIGEVVTEAKELAAKWNVSTFYCDPSEPANIAEMNGAGLSAIGADNAVSEGIQRVKARLAIAGDGQPRLMIAPQCVNALAEFESYCWKSGRAGMKDEPEKTNDHAMDALRYAIMGIDGGMMGSMSDVPQAADRPSRWDVKAEWR